MDINIDIYTNTFLDSTIYVSIYIYIHIWSNREKHFIQLYNNLPSHIRHVSILSF